METVTISTGGGKLDVPALLVSKHFTITQGRQEDGEEGQYVLGHKRTGRKMATYHRLSQATLVLDRLESVRGVRWDFDTTDLGGRDNRQAVLAAWHDANRED